MSVFKYIRCDKKKNVATFNLPKIPFILKQLLVQAVQLIPAKGKGGVLHA